MCEKTLRRFVLLALTGLLLVVCTGNQAGAARYRRGRGRSNTQAAAARRQQTLQAAQAQIAAAKQVLAAAEYKGGNAQGRLQEAMGKLQHAAADADKAEDAVNSLQKELLKIEEEILGEQSVDTDYTRVRTELLAAKKEMAEARAEVLARPEVARELELLKGVPKTTATNKLLESSPRYVAAHNRVTVAGSELEKIKSQLFHADTDWKETRHALSEVQHDISVAKGEASTAGFSRLKPLTEYREASQAAAAARAAIAQAEGVIRSLGPAAKSGSSTNSVAKKK